MGSPIQFPIPYWIRVLRRPRPVRTGRPVSGGGGQGRGPVGRGTQVSVLRETHSPVQGPASSPAGTGGDCKRRGGGGTGATPNAAAILGTVSALEGPLGIAEQVAVRAGVGHLHVRATICVGGWSCGGSGHSGEAAGLPATGRSLIIWGPSSPFCSCVRAFLLPGTTGLFPPVSSCAWYHLPWITLAGSISIGHAV